MKDFFVLYNSDNSQHAWPPPHNLVPPRRDLYLHYDFDRIFAELLTKTTLNSQGIASKLSQSTYTRTKSISDTSCVFSQVSRTSAYIHQHLAQSFSVSDARDLK